MSEPEPTRRPMTLSEAGRKGGEKVKRERGPDFYAEIGRKGGRRVAQDHGPSFYSEIGRKGGEARRHEGSDGVPDPSGSSKQDAPEARDSED